MPRPVHHAALAAVNGKIYVMGGFVAPATKAIPLGAAWEPVADAYEFNPATDSWKALAPLPGKRGAAIAAEVGGKIYVIGGATTMDGDKAPFFTAFGPAKVLGTNDVYDPATNKWESRNPMSVPRNHAFGGVVNGKIYVIGGRTGHGFILSATNTDVVEEYDPASNAWSMPKERMPTARSGGASGTDGRLIYVAGGEVTTTELVGAYRAVEAYSPATNSWITLPSMPMPRHGVAGGVVGDRFHLVSGMIQSSGALTFLDPLSAPHRDARHPGTAILPGSDGECAAFEGPLNHFNHSEGLHVESFTTGNRDARPGGGQPDFRHGRAGSDAARLPGRRRRRSRNRMKNSTALPCGGKMYVIGGWGEGKARGVNYEYDPATDKWTKKKSMPRPAHHAALAAYNGKIYVCGGFVPPEETQIPTGGAWQPIDDVWEYDPAADSWKTLAPLPGNRGAAVAVEAGGKIYVIGGVTTVEGSKDPFFTFFGPCQVLNTNDVYDPATNKWESRKPMAVPRNHAFAGAVNGKIYVIGGRTGHGFILSATNTDVVEEYNPVADMWSAPKERMPTPRSGGGYGTDGRRIYCAGGEVTTKAARRRVSSHRGVRAGDQFLDDAALHADAASWRRGRGDRQSLSPGERDDHVRRRDGDARPEARSPHGVTRRVGAAVQSESSDGCDERAERLRRSAEARRRASQRVQAATLRRRARRLLRARRSSTRATTSTAPKAK